MFTLTFNYSDRGIRSIINEFEGWYGIRLTETQLEKLLKKNHNLLNGVNPTGIDSTGAREELADAVCQEIGMSRSWPVNADGEKAFKKFVKELKVKAKHKGYKVTGFED